MNIDPWSCIQLEPLYVIGDFVVNNLFLFELCQQWDSIVDCVENRHELHLQRNPSHLLHVDLEAIQCFGDDLFRL
jgi:hypothetical protein